VSDSADKQGEGVFDGSVECGQPSLVYRGGEEGRRVWQDFLNLVDWFETDAGESESGSNK